MEMTITTVLSVVLGLGLLNVWLVRAGSPTAFRGGASRTLKEEFEAYGLPGWMFYAVGTLKVGAALTLLAGPWVPALVAPAAGVVAVLMMGALAMHARVRDPLMKSAPAMLMLVLSGSAALVG